MDWNLDWIFFGAAAFMLVIINIARGCAGKTRGWQALMLASMSCALFAVIAELRMAASWASHGDIPALTDSLPGMCRIMTIAAVIGIILNILAMLINISAEAE